jgi:single-stranded DNA-binding protein
MISVLITGNLISKPTSRISKNGNAYVTGQIRVSVDGESILCSLVAFNEQCQSLLALDKGDSVSAAGTGKPTAWTNKSGELTAGLSLKVEQVMTVYRVKEKRKASQQADKQPYLPAQSPLLDAGRDADDAPF